MTTDATPVETGDVPSLGTPDAAPSGVRRLGGLLLSDSALAVGDQAVVSGTRFVTTVAVGRAAGATELGAYTLAMAALLLAGCVQESLVTKPYTVLRTGRGDRRFAGSVLAHHVGLGMLLTWGLLAASGVCFALGAFGAGLILAALAGAAPLSLLWEFARRMSFAHLRLRSALAVDAAFSALQLCGLAALWAAGWLTAVTALAVTGAAAGLAGGGWLLARRAAFAPRRRRAVADAAGNWRFGRWILGGQLCGQVKGLAPHWILAGLAGVAATGRFAAAQNVVMLTNPLILAVASLLVAQTAQARRDGGAAAVRAVALRAGLGLAAAAGLFWVGLLFAARPLLGLIYGDEFVAAAPAILVLGLSPVAAAAAVAFEAGLTAVDRPDLSFRALVAGLAVTLLAAALLCGPLGTVGAAAAVTAGSAAAAAALGVYFLRETAAPPPA